MTLDILLPQFLALGGVAALVTALVNVLKQFNVVKDGQASIASLILNVLGFVTLIALKVLAPDFDFTGIDTSAGSIAQILILVLGLVVQLSASQKAHSTLRGLPVIGKSYSA